MMILKNNRLSWLAVAAVWLTGASAYGQSPKPPLLQDIQIQSQNHSAVPSATPLVQRTGSVAPVGAGGVRTLFPALGAVQIPGYSGILIESLEGNVVLETNSQFTFNPASNVKIATAYAVLKTFGPEFRFLTNVYTDGSLNPNTGALTGNLYVSGQDPIFGYEHAITLANELNRLGIRSISGDLVVTDNFAMNYSGSPQVSGRTLFNSIDSSKRPAAATRVWLEHLRDSGRIGQVIGTPSVAFNGNVYVQPVPSNLTHLFTHESAPIREILKATLAYSNNFLSERLGGLVGGPYGVARMVHLNARVPPAEFSIQTCSGLGFNRVTPNAMMRLLRALRSDLAKYKMTFADIMPVAGLDQGTLSGRFDADFSRGSVVGKTGTLNNTDGGVSALAGEVNTRNGRLLFVIFNQRGSVPRFRTFQNFFVSLVQGQFGGAVPIKYEPVPMSSRMARSRVSYPNNAAFGND